MYFFILCEISMALVKRALKRENLILSFCFQVVTCRPSHMLPKMRKWYNTRKYPFWALHTKQSIKGFIAQCNRHQSSTNQFLVSSSLRLHFWTSDAKDNWVRFFYSFFGAWGIYLYLSPLICQGNIHMLCKHLLGEKMVT